MLVNSGLRKRAYRWGGRLLSRLLLGLESEVGVDPAAAEGEQHAEPLAGSENLAFAVPADGQDEDGLEVGDDVEGKGGSTTDDKELGQIVE